MVRSLRIGHRRFVLGRGINTIGRDPASTVCINDASVSRHHARITVDGNAVVLEDLQSKNGTQVMGKMTVGATPLNDGDEIEFGHVKGWYIAEVADDPPTTMQL